MTKCYLIILSILCFSITQSDAQIYRWVDKDGGVHYTDNQSLIPADRLEQSYKLSPDAMPDNFSQSETPTPSTSTTTAAPSPTASAKRLQLQQKEKELKARIAAAQKERQRYFEQINAMRPVQMTAETGGGKRRRVVAWGRSLAASERRLDTLHEELQQVQSKLQALEQTPPPSTAVDSQTQNMLFDKQNHTRAYWQRRSTPLHNRIQQMNVRRQAILEQLSSDSQVPIGAERGKEVLRLTRELQQVNQDLNRATTDLQNLQQEAARAGAPDDWLQ
jgi:seryl-tRNA synthetase